MNIVATEAFHVLKTGALFDGLLPGFLFVVLALSQRAKARRNIFIFCVAALAYLLIEFAGLYHGQGNRRRVSIVV
jgi:hypothetical protein